MIDKHVMLFVSSGCEPCSRELADLAKYRKMDSFENDQARFVIVNLADSNHLMLVELFKPTTTPEIKIVDIDNFKISKTYSGVGCIDTAWDYLGFATPPNLTNSAEAVNHAEIDEILHDMKEDSANTDDEYVKSLKNIKLNLTGPTATPPVTKTFVDNATINNATINNATVTVPVPETKVIRGTAEEIALATEYANQLNEEMSNND
jgi:hypothetical protein